MFILFVINSDDAYSQQWLILCLVAILSFLFFYDINLFKAALKLLLKMLKEKEINVGKLRYIIRTLKLDKAIILAEIEKELNKHI